MFCVEFKVNLKYHHKYCHKIYKIVHLVSIWGRTILLHFYKYWD